MNTATDKSFPATVALLSPAALAARWGVTEGALAQRRRRGQPPSFVFLGRKSVRYPLAAVEAYERSLTTFGSTRQAQAVLDDPAKLALGRKSMARARALAPKRRRAAKRLAERAESRP